MFLFRDYFPSGCRGSWPFSLPYFKSAHSIAVASENRGVIFFFFYLLSWYSGFEFYTSCLNKFRKTSVPYYITHSWVSFYTIDNPTESLSDVQGRTLLKKTEVRNPYYGEMQTTVHPRLEEVKIVVIMKAFPREYAAWSCISGQEDEWNIVITKFIPWLDLVLK